MTKRDIEIADHLAREGNTFSIGLRDDNRPYFTALPNSYFAIASAIALCWTGHAQFEEGFIEYAAGFIEGSVTHDPNIAISYCRRFGAEQLDDALRNFRAFHNRVRHLMPDFNSCSIQEINRLQARLLTLLEGFRNNGQVTGIGPWLFLGPFKIILSDQQRLWNVEGINAIVLPVGMEVVRGMNRLHDEGYTFMRNFDPHWLIEGAGSLIDSFATCTMVHAHVIEIANLGNTTGLHINSALYQYGRQDI